MNFNLHFGELHSDNSINDKNNLFENYIPKCDKIKIILISFNCFSEYRRLLFCIYILFSHDEITLEEIQQKLNSPETFEDFKRLWWISISYLMEKDTLITFEN